MVYLNIIFQVLLLVLGILQLINKDYVMSSLALIMVELVHIENILRLGKGKK